ncbi:hypothetical protein Hanom_Chr11g01045861 [Helianthus anomalus]
MKMKLYCSSVWLSSFVCFIIVYVIVLMVSVFLDEGLIAHLRAIDLIVLRHLT